MNFLQLWMFSTLCIVSWLMIVYLTVKVAVKTWYRYRPDLTVNVNFNKEKK